MNGSNGWNGLDGRSLLIGGGLVLAGMIAVKSAPLVPLVLIGGLIWLVGNKKGWWGARHNGFNGHAGHGGPPAPASFYEWHRQAHGGQPHAGQANGAQTPPQTQTTPPTQAETTQTSRPGDWPMI